MADHEDRIARLEEAFAHIERLEEYVAALEEHVVGLAVRVTVLSANQRPMPHPGSPEAMASAMHWLSTLSMRSN